MMMMRTAMKNDCDKRDVEFWRVFTTGLIEGKKTGILIEGTQVKY